MPSPVETSPKSREEQYAWFFFTFSTPSRSFFNPLIIFPECALKRLFRSRCIPWSNFKRTAFHQYAAEGGKNPQGNNRQEDPWISQNRRYLLRWNALSTLKFGKPSERVNDHAVSDGCEAIRTEGLSCKVRQIKQYQDHATGKQVRFNKKREEKHLPGISFPASLSARFLAPSTLPIS